MDPFDYIFHKKTEYNDLETIIDLMYYTPIVKRDIITLLLNRIVFRNEIKFGDIFKNCVITNYKENNKYMIYRILSSYKNKDTVLSKIQGMIGLCSFLSEGKHTPESWEDLYPKKIFCLPYDFTQERMLNFMIRNANGRVIPEIYESN